MDELLAERQAEAFVEALDRDDPEFEELRKKAWNESLADYFDRTKSQTQRSLRKLGHSESG